MTPEELKKMLQNPHTADWSKLDPKDVGFTVGKPMTEAEMRAYCQNNGVKPTIMKKPEQKKPGNDQK
jgi:hypothetical protein